MMKHKFSLWASLVAVAMLMASCDVIGGIFKAGFWAAIIIILLVAGLIIWLLRRFRR